MRILLAFIILTPWQLVAQELLKAPNEKATPVNQRRAYGNACGPASLLNAFQYGDEKWQKAFHAVPGKDSRTRLRFVVGTWGNKPSLHVKSVNRWNPKQGVNLLDLTDMANEMRAPYFLPKIKQEVISRGSRDDLGKLLKRSHARLADSLKKGLPPIISIRRYAYRYSKEVGQKSWWPIRAHFVVVTEIPRKLPRGATSFKIKYIDPYGGFTREGTIHTDTGSFKHSPFLATTMPNTLVGKSLLKPGEETILTFSAIIGVW
ncbi:MAG: hypothetical protein H7A51_05570 [Akkermansiaceae bacterium]|nr:hypothetical protein [Akkermansiaceae bacterium]